MKRKMLGLLLSGGLLLTAASAAELTGWISDSNCGAGNASSKASARTCAERCIKEGAAPVFVSESDQKVYKLSDAAKANAHLKGKVKITGAIKGDTITITDIKDAGV
jgi:hypothetical protein